MHNLIYFSSASYFFSDEELINILNKSRLNNTRLNITGLLLYNEGCILQILEGEKDVLNTLFETISQDMRHKSIIKMIDGSIDERNFQEWSMGFKQISKTDWNTLHGYLNLDNKDELKRLANSGSKSVISMIKSFAYVNTLMTI